LTTSGNYTQYKISLAIFKSAGNLTLGETYSPVINSNLSRAYTIQVTVAADIQMNLGDSLALVLLNQDQRGYYTNTGLILFDSASKPSSLSTPESGSNISQATTPMLTSMNSFTGHLTQTTTVPKTQTTYQQPTVALDSSSITKFEPELTASSSPAFTVAIIICAGAAAAAGGLALGLVERKSKVIAQGGAYYCKRHRTLLINRNGALWCPQERRYLN
jgi:hypothetical protein